MQITIYYISENSACRIFRVSRYGRVLLLKALKPEHIGQPHFEEALNREFQTGYQLNHKGIARTEGWEQREDIGYCIVMEYVDGVPLRRLLSENRLSADVAWSIAGQLVEVMAYMHGREVVHHDLRPENILVTRRDHQVKLIDFSRSGEGDVREDISSLGQVFLEMARSVGDRNLKRIGDRCTRHQYSSMSEVRDALRAPKHNPWWPWGMILGVFTLVLLGLGIYFSTTFLSSGPDAVTSGHDSARLHYHVSEQVLQALHQEQARLQQCDTCDTAASVARLKAALDKEFSTAAERDGEDYRLQWELLLKQLKQK